MQNENRLSQLCYVLKATSVNPDITITAQRREDCFRSNCQERYYFPKNFDIFNTILAYAYFSRDDKCREIKSILTRGGISE